MSLSLKAPIVGSQFREALLMAALRAAAWAVHVAAVSGLLVQFAIVAPLVRVAYMKALAMVL